MRGRAGLLFLLLVVLAAGDAPGEPTFTLEEGEIEGAPFALGIPESWNGRVLLIAHGWRPPRAPLMAVLDPADPVVATRLADGWLVAATGYRRNGWIIEDAARDLTLLLEYISETQGQPSSVVLEGTSLGANIGLSMAEGDTPPFDGLLALGADPMAEGPDGPIAWTFHPTVPVIFFSNRSEYEPVEAYAARVGDGAIRPALMWADRDGHVNLSGPERLLAHSDLDRWLEDRVRPPGWVGRPHDATIFAEEPPSRAVVGPGWREGRIVRVDPVYGNIDTDLVAGDLRAQGIVPGDHFRVSCVAGPRRVFWGSTYGDVNEGKLVAFVSADGFLRLVVNGGDASRRLDGRVADAVIVEPISKENGHDSRGGNRSEDGRVQRDPRHH